MGAASNLSVGAVHGRRDVRQTSNIHQVTWTSNTGTSTTPGHQTQGRQTSKQHRARRERTHGPCSCMQAAAAQEQQMQCRRRAACNCILLAISIARRKERSCSYAHMMHKFRLIRRVQCFWVLWMGGLLQEAISGFLLQPARRRGRMHEYDARAENDVSCALTKAYESTVCNFRAQLRICVNCARQRNWDTDRRRCAQMGNACERLQ